MKIGEIDVVNSIVNLEHDVFVLQQALDFIATNNKGNLKSPTLIDVQKFKNNAIEMLQKKYPKMGIKKK